MRPVIDTRAKMVTECITYQLQNFLIIHHISFIYKYTQMFHADLDKENNNL